MAKRFYGLILLWIWQVCAHALTLESASIDLNDKPALQRGARLYVNYCLGCHSLAYIRYNHLAQDLAIVDSQGKIAEAIVKANIILTGASGDDWAGSAMSPSDAQSWFGVTPPDLTLIARRKGADWLYTYLKGFYRDETRPSGSNNSLVPNVAMPNVLWSLQGTQIPVYQSLATTQRVIDHLVLIQPGELSKSQFNAAMNDLVGFLVYVSDPNRLQREHLGYWVFLYLIVFLLSLYGLFKQVIVKSRL